MLNYMWMNVSLMYVLPFCTYIFKCIYTYIHTYSNTYMYTYFIDMHVYTCKSAYHCIPICMYICFYMFFLNEHVCIYMYMYKYIFIYLYLYAYVSRYIYLFFLGKCIFIDAHLFESWLIGIVLRSPTKAMATTCQRQSCGTGWRHLGFNVKSPTHQWES